MVCWALLVTLPIGWMRFMIPAMTDSNWLKIGAHWVSVTLPE